MTEYPQPGNNPGTNPYPTGQPYPQHADPAQPVYGFTNPPEPPKKKRKGLIIGVIIVALLGIFGIVGALSGDGDENPVGSVPTTTAEEPADEPTTDAEPVAEEEEETTEEPPAAEPDGTRQNPGIIGQHTWTGTSYEDDGVLTAIPTEITWDANQIVADENMFNDEPDEGMKYVIVSFTFTYEGPSSMDPAIEVRVQALKDGRTYDEAWQVIPNSVNEIGDLYDGGTADGSVVLMVPEDADGSNTLIGVGGGIDEPIWFTEAAE